MKMQKTPEEILSEHLTKYFYLAKEHREALERLQNMETMLKVLESNLKELRQEREELAQIAVLLNVEVDLSNPRKMIMSIYDKVKTLLQI